MKLIKSGNYVINVITIISLEKLVSVIVYQKLQKYREVNIGPRMVCVYLSLNLLEKIRIQERYSKLKLNYGIVVEVQGMQNNIIMHVISSTC